MRDRSTDYLRTVSRPTRSSVATYDLVSMVGEPPIQTGHHKDNHTGHPLDCAVIEKFCEISNKPINTVRCVFCEGERLFETSHFRSGSHICIAVRDEWCKDGIQLVDVCDKWWKLRRLASHLGVY